MGLCVHTDTTWQSTCLPANFTAGCTVEALSTIQLATSRCLRKSPGLFPVHIPPLAVKASHARHTGMASKEPAHVTDTQVQHVPGMLNGRPAIQGRHTTQRRKIHHKYARDTRCRLTGTRCVTHTERSSAQDTSKDEP